MGALQQILAAEVAGGGATGSPFITAYTTVGTRNDFDGCVGFKFTVGGSNITITDLGRWKISGNTGTHTVKITATDGTVIVSASVDLTTGSAGGFVYASCTPTVLNASTTYCCLSAEANGGDQWYDSAAVDSTASGATIGFDVYQVACSGAPTDANSGVRSYVPPNFKFY